MIKKVENFMNTYGKYMAATAITLKPMSKDELQFVADLFRNDSQR
ncbi:hypothetical protein [Neobacillus vireti]